MSDDSRRFVIAYDIVDDRRRSRVAKCLQSYGVRVQFSVFLVDTRPAKLMRLLALLDDRIESSEDSVMVCDLGPVHALTTSTLLYLGNSRAEPPRQSIII